MFFGRLKDYRSKDDQADIFDDSQLAVVKQLHERSTKQLWQLIPFGLEYVWQHIRNKPISFKGKPFQSLTLGIDARQGRLLYGLTLAKRPKVIFEYGTSYGISTLYFAKALQDIREGHIYTCEIESQKIAESTSNFKHSGLEERITLLEGDVCDNLEQFRKTIDLVFMDGYPGLNLEVLKLLEPSLNSGSLIITDDARLFALEMKDYLEYLDTSKDYCNHMLEGSTGTLLTVKK